MTTFLKTETIVRNLLETPTGNTVSVIPGLSVPDKGYLVGIKEFERVSDQLSLVVDTYNYVKDFRGRVGLDGNFLGVWRDDESGLFYLDVVRFFAEKAPAEEFGHKNGQIAIYDLGKREEVRL